MFKKKRQRSPVNNFQLQILRLLRYKPMYGYEILKIFEQKGWRPSTGTLYPSLKQLEKKGFIEVFETPPTRGIKNRHNYKLTKKGFDHVQNTYNIDIQHPELYIEPFRDLRNFLINGIVQTKVLVLDFLNFINPEKVLKVLFTTELPSNIEFKKVYDFNLENPKSQVYDYIFLFLPFSFIYRDFYSNPDLNHLKVLQDIRLALKPNGSIMIIDIEWTKHALVDILSFIATGEVMQMAYTEEEIQDLLIRAGYKNINTLRKERGIIVLVAQNSNIES